MAKLTFDDYRKRNIEIVETAQVAMARHKAANRVAHYDKKLAEAHLYSSLHTDSWIGARTQLQAMSIQEVFPLAEQEPPFDMALYIDTFHRLAKHELESLMQYGP